VKDAVGFDAARGDSVNVVNSSFDGDQPAPEGEIESTPIWENPLLQDAGKVLAGLIVLLVLILSVLKPLVKGLITPTRVALAGPAPQAALDTPPAARSAGGALPAGGATPQLAYEQQLAQARTLVTQDPKRVAQVVRTWVAQDE
jgi:flagellar M-ring protein FliF